MKGGILERLRKSVEQGNLLELCDILEDIHPEEPVILSARYDRSVFIKRPSTEGKLEVRQPNLLMIAVLGWFPEIVGKLLQIGADVNDVCEIVEYDDSTAPNAFGNVTAVMLAAITGRLEHARYLVDNGALVNSQDSRGETALMKACLEEHLSVLDLLVTSGANIELEDHNKATPLMRAAEAGYLTIVTKLLNLGADINKRDFHGRNALFYAAVSPTQTNELVKLLIGNGCHPLSDNQGVSLLMQASSAGDYDLVEYLLAGKSRFNFHSNESDLYGRNALYHACLGGSQEVVEYLVQSGEQFIPAIDHSTAIMAAAMRNHTNLLHCLIPRCARFNLDMSAIDTMGRNVLFYSVQGGSIDNFEFLIKCGVEIQADNNLQNLLMYAVELKRTQIINYILDNEKIFPMIKINDVDREGKNVLFYAVHSGNIELFNKLYNHGAETCVTYRGVSLLMHACKMGYPKFAGFLFENRETLDLSVAWKDNDGRNILFYCVEGGNVAILDFFLESTEPETAPSGFTLLMEAAMHSKSQMIQRVLSIPDIDFTATDEKGQNALFYSVLSGRTEVLQLLLQKGLTPSPNNDGTTLLMLAAQHGTAPATTGQPACRSPTVPNGLVTSDDQNRYKMLDFLLEHSTRLGLNINSLDNQGRNILFYGVLSCDRGVLNKLKQTGVTPVIDKNGQTLLMCACSTGLLEIVDWLFDSFNERKEFTFDSSAQDEHGNDVYFYCLLLGGSVRLILHLLSEYRVPTRCNKLGHSWLAILYSQGGESVTNDAKLILDYLEKYCNNNAEHQMIEILCGIDNDKGLSVFDYFVKLDDINSLKRYRHYYRSDKAVHSLLYTATENQCSLEAIECLMEYYLMHKLSDKRKRKILHLSVELGAPIPVVKLFLSYGFRPTALSKDGSNILHACCITRNYNLFRHFLLFFKEDILPMMTRVNSSERSILHIICEQGMVDFFDVLFDNISEEVIKELVELVNSFDQNTLMFACASGKDEFFTNPLFLKHSIENKDLLLAVDNEQCNALHYACSSVCPHPAIVERLLNSGLSPDSTNKEQSTPLMLAIQRDNLKVIKQLLGDRASDRMMEQNCEGWNSFDLCSLKQNVVSLFVEKEFGLDKSSETFLDLLLNFSPDTIDLQDLAKTLSERSLILSRQNAQSVCNIMCDANKGQAWSMLVNFIALRGKGRLSELCSLLTTYDAQLAAELSILLNEEEQLPDEF